MLCSAGRVEQAAEVDDNEFRQHICSHTVDAQTIDTKKRYVECTTEAKKASHGNRLEFFQIFRCIYGFMDMS